MTKLITLLLLATTACTSSLDPAGLIARDRVLTVIAERPRWHAVHRALLGSESGRTLLVVTLLRIPPASPFALTNFVLAAGRVPLWDYTLGTLIGIAPRTAAAAFAAAGLEQLRFKNVSENWMVVAGIIVTIVVCVVLGVLSNRALRSMCSSPARLSNWFSKKKSRC